jgi:hypothetical protein
VIWNCVLDNPNTSKKDCKADGESDLKPDNGSKDSERPEHWVVSAMPNVPRLLWPTWRSQKTPDKGSMTVRAMETRRNKGNKTK